MNQFTASLWGDEAFSAVLSAKSIPKIISIIASDTSPPLYNITEHFWFGLFGSGEVAIRAFSFLYFLIAVFFVYKIGALLLGRKPGILAATLSFLNPFFFTYAFEGRMYSILAATVLASTYFFLKRNWVFYILATTLALYSHHFSIFAVFVQGLWFLKELIVGSGGRKVAVKTLYSFVTIALLYSPWLIPLYNQTQLVGSGFWLGRPTATDLLNLIFTYLAKGIKHPLAQPTLVLILATLFTGISRKNFRQILLLLSGFLLPIVATWLISQKFQSIFFDRYLLYTIPFAMLLVASSETKLSKITFPLIISAFLVIDVLYFTNPTKPPFKELALYVKETKRGDDLVLNWNAASHHLWESKYYGIPAPIYVKNPKTLPFFVGTALMEEADTISSIPKNTNRVGVITSSDASQVKIEDFTKSEVKTFGQLKFIWLSK